MKYLKRYYPILISVALYFLITFLRSKKILNGYIVQVLMIAGINTIMTCSLNLINGFTGQFCIGHAGFMSLGAYGSAVITTLVFGGKAHTPAAMQPVVFILGLIVGGCVAAIIGALIGLPSLKLKGDYLAIVTLAFGEIIKSLINNLYIGFDANGFQFSFVENKLKLAPGGKALINGPMGATGTQRIATFTVGIILVLAALIVIYNIMYSRSGRAIQACRDNRIAAESVGIHVANTKMLAFVISAGLAGAAGALYGLNYSTLLPAKFDFNLSILVLVYVVLGGLGNMTGTIISTIILVILPELLRGLQDYRMLIYAIVLILMMILSNNAKVRQYAESLKQKLSFKKKEEAANE